MSEKTKDISNLDACIAIVSKFNKGRTTMTETEIQELRARLSVGQVYLIEYDYRAALEDLTLMELEMDRVETRVYNRHLEVREKIESSSAAKDNARRLQKGDEEYLDAKMNYLQSKNIVNIFDKQIKQLHQVLNSMARRSG
jgi:hypothetical protein